MAESVLRAMLARSGVDAAAVVIESAGTHDYQAGKPPSELTVQAARGRGYEICERRARPVTPGDFDRFDHILAMDRANLAHLRAICPTRCKHKVELLLEYGDEHHGQEVPDPYGGDPRGYDRALELIEDGCRGLAVILARRA